MKYDSHKYTFVFLLLWSSRNALLKEMFTVCCQLFILGNPRADIQGETKQTKRRKSVRSKGYNRPLYPKSSPGTLLDP